MNYSQTKIYNHKTYFSEYTRYKKVNIQGHILGTSLKNILLDKALKLKKILITNCHKNYPNIEKNLNGIILNIQKDLNDGVLNIEDNVYKLQRLFSEYNVYKLKSLFSKEEEKYQCSQFITLVCSLAKHNTESETKINWFGCVNKTLHISSLLQPDKKNSQKSNLYPLNNSVSEVKKGSDQDDLLRSDEDSRKHNTYRRCKYYVILSILYSIYGRL